MSSHLEIKQFDSNFLSVKFKLNFPLARAPGGGSRPQYARVPHMECTSSVLARSPVICSTNDITLDTVMTLESIPGPSGAWLGARWRWDTATPEGTATWRRNGREEAVHWLDKVTPCEFLVVWNKTFYPLPPLYHPFPLQKKTHNPNKPRGGQVVNLWGQVGNMDNHIQVGSV